MCPILLFPSLVIVTFVRCLGSCKLLCRNPLEKWVSLCKPGASFNNHYLRVTGWDTPERWACLPAMEFPLLFRMLVTVKYKPKSLKMVHSEKYHQPEEKGRGTFDEDLLAFGEHTVKNLARLICRSELMPSEGTVQPDNSGGQSQWLQHSGARCYFEPKGQELAGAGCLEESCSLQ